MGSRFFKILYDSLGFFKFQISIRFLRVNSLGFFEILWDSLGFFVGCRGRIAVAEEFFGILKDS